jgi:hypothetical protein
LLLFVVGLVVCEGREPDFRDLFEAEFLFDGTWKAETLKREKAAHKIPFSHQQIIHANTSN